jgi:hypothetical protein
VTTAEATETTAPSLEHTEGGGPLRGLVGLTAAELRRWFPGRALALAATGLVVAVAVFAIWSGSAGVDDPRLGTYLFPLFGLWIVVLVLLMVATAQGAMANEVEEGTAAWVVAKPVGRPAFVLSKFVAAVPGVIIGAIVVPGIVVRELMFRAAAKGDTTFGAGEVLRLLEPATGVRDEFTTVPTLGRYLGTLALITAVLLLIVAVMILLGCVVHSRAVLFLVGLAVPIGLLVFSGVGPAEIVELTPAWAFASLLDTIIDDPAPVLAPMLVTGAWTAGVMLLAVAWFSRREL